MSERVLDRFQVAMQQRISLSVLPDGVHDERLAMMVDATTDHLVASLTAFVLGEQAGPIERDHAFRTVADFPRYIPKWLRRRWSHDESVTLTATPRWTYPNSSISVPALGDPTRQIVYSLESFGESE